MFKHTVQSHVPLLFCPSCRAWRACMQGRCNMIQDTVVAGTRTGMHMHALIVLEAVQGFLLALNKTLIAIHS